MSADLCTHEARARAREQRNQSVSMKEKPVADLDLTVDGRKGTMVSANPLYGAQWVPSIPKAIQLT